MPGPLSGAQQTYGGEAPPSVLDLGGDEAVLPPIHSKDPGIPGTLEVGYLGPLLENSQYTTAVPAGGYWFMRCTTGHQPGDFLS